jgi:hypothetical protein
MDQPTIKLNVATITVGQKEVPLKKEHIKQLEWLYQYDGKFAKDQIRPLMRVGMGFGDTIIIWQTPRGPMQQALSDYVNNPYQESFGTWTNIPKVILL